MRRRSLRALTSPCNTLQKFSRVKLLRKQAFADYFFNPSFPKESQRMFLRCNIIQPHHYPREWSAKGISLVPANLGMRNSNTVHSSAVISPHESTLYLLLTLKMKS